MLNIGNRNKTKDISLNSNSYGKASKVRDDKTNNSSELKNIAGSGYEGICMRLKGSFFRKINEYLYTNNSDDAFKLYMDDNSLFENYHKGYEIQKSLWPMDPLDNIINYISRNRNLKIIGDFGCGKARIGQIFNKKKGYKVYSFDLNCSEEFRKKYNITICNMKRVPLTNNTLDLAIFCLSLMGTDWPLFVKEASRVLKDKGTLIVAEVTSRIQDISDFIKSIENLNFKLIGDPINVTNYFTQFTFIKRQSKKICDSGISDKFRFPNEYYLSRDKYLSGSRLHWMSFVSKCFKLRKSKLVDSDINEVEIDHSILRPCMYKKR